MFNVSSLFLADLFYKRRSHSLMLLKRGCNSTVLKFPKISKHSDEQPTEAHARKYGCKASSGVKTLSNSVNVEIGNEFSPFILYLAEKNSLFY